MGKGTTTSLRGGQEAAAAAVGWEWERSQSANNF